ncbi:hypothetical protein [Clostridium vitabionis]|uniref:hypothetical protein n=1 Tax=Clostridium vitabionis TaxID=2784388 RepID=UPI00188B1AC5|nr:hypothetical protein [Clostridium vitabionis]
MRILYITRVFCILDILPAMDIRAIGDIQDFFLSIRHIRFLLGSQGKEISERAFQEENCIPAKRKIPTGMQSLELKSLYFFCLNTSNEICLIVGSIRMHGLREFH